MSAEKFKNLYRIPSARAQWHDYNGGCYFVTICTKYRKHYFGEIINGDDKHFKNENNDKWISPIHAKLTMVLSPIGQYAHEQFRDATKHYLYAEIMVWVVMPNHIHAVVMIDENVMADNKTVVETMFTSSLQREQREQRWKHETIDQNMQIISLRRGKLSTVIGGLKRAVTHFATTHAIPFAWQPRFHDHIIRNTHELNRIAVYIEQNVAKWGSDKFYK